MVRDKLSILSAFLAVAEERSFTRAAKRLGVSQSALSHAIRGALDRISGLREIPAGRVRLLVSPIASMVLAPKLGQFARDFPDAVLDVATRESHVDLVAASFDTGIQFGEFIEQDMVALRVSPDFRPAIVGSPAYFESHPTPQAPGDLLKHRCINYPHGSSHWLIGIVLLGRGPWWWDRSRGRGKFPAASRPSAPTKSAAPRLIPWSSASFQRKKFGP